MADQSARDSAESSHQGEQDSTLEALFEGTSDPICQFADITLVVDDEFHPKIKLEVSSCILAMASDVFEAMLKKNFAEGQRREGQARKEVPINDHPKAMRAFCRILHHLPPRDKSEESSFPILELAIIADKYSCVDTIRLAARGLLENLIQPYRDSIAPLSVPLHDLVAATFILDQPDQFRWLTRDLVLSTKSIRAEHFPAKSLDFLPTRFISSVVAQQNAARNELTYRINVLLDAFSRCARLEDATHLIPLFIGDLSDNNLFPLSINKSCIRDILLKLPDVTIPIVRSVNSDCHCDALRFFIGINPPTHGDFTVVDWHYHSLGYEPARWHSQACFERQHEPGEPDQSHILVIVKNTEDICVGACLDCCRETDKEKINCRVAHPQPWNAVERTDAPCLLDLDSFVNFDEVERRLKWASGSVADTRLKPDWWEDTW